MVTHIKKTMVGNKLYLLGFIVVFDVKNSKYIYIENMPTILLSDIIQIQTYMQYLIWFPVF